MRSEVGGRRKVGELTTKDAEGAKVEGQFHVFSVFRSSMPERADRGRLLTIRVLFIDVDYDYDKDYDHD